LHLSWEPTIQEITMRKPSPTTLAAAIAIALFAQAADAQNRGAANAGRTNAGPNASASNATANAGVTNTANGAGNVGTAAQGGTINPNQASGTVVLGSTSAGNVVSVGTPIAGVNTGTNPNPNATQGQTSPGATGNNATGTSQGQTSGTGNGSTSPGVTPSSTQNLNLQGAQLLDTQGRVLTDANGLPLTFDSRGMIGVAPGGGVATDAGVGTQVVVLNPRDLAGSVTSTPELDRATRKELNKAKMASRSRNKQLLNTIAPRTNADRTDQMADDPPSPALSTPSRSLPNY
jgi:hypothetical protein